AFRHRALERLEPGADRQSALQQAVLPDVDMGRCLQREAEAGRVMLEHRRRNTKRRLTMERAVASHVCRCRLRSKTRLQAELRTRRRTRRVELIDDEDEIASVGLDEVPAIALKLVIDALGKACRAMKLHHLLAANQKPQQLVETDEVIDMRMRDEYLVDAVRFARRQRGNVAEIEHQAALFEQRVDINSRIAVASVNQAGMEKRSHGALFCRGRSFVMDARRTSTL